MTPGGYPSPTTRPRAILFDWDNTLVDNWPAIHRALNATFAVMGHVPWTFEETKARVRRSLRDSFPEMFGPRWTEARTIFYNAFSAAHLDCLEPMPDADETLAWLAGEDIYLAVVSNKTGTYLREEARALGWDHYFGRIVGAADATADKPAAAPVLLALSGSGIEAGPEVWFLGDGAVDAQCALTAGITPLLLESPGIRDELMRHNIDEFVLQPLWVRGVAGLKSMLPAASRAGGRFPSG